MSEDDQSATAEWLLTAIGRELRRQTDALAAIIELVQPARWEYLLVQINARKEHWYEYHANGNKLDDLDNKAVFVMLNEMGEQGWELVDVMPSGDFYFKRRRSPWVEPGEEEVEDDGAA